MMINMINMIDDGIVRVDDHFKMAKSKRVKR